MMTHQISLFLFLRRAVAWLCVILAASAVVTSPAEAQKKSEGALKPDRLAQLFDEICYSSLPDFTPVIERAKTENWTPITGDALKAYRPSAETDQLSAWSFMSGGKRLRVALSSSPVDKPMAELLPAFSKGRSFACSLILPGTLPQAALQKSMKRMVGRKPDETYAEPPWTVDFWSGITDDLAALLYHYRPKSGRPGGLFSFVVLKK